MSGRTGAFEFGSEVAAILRELSGRHMVTQTDLARFVGTTQAQMSKVLRGERALDVDQLHRAAHRLHTTASAILASAESAVGPISPPPPHHTRHREPQRSSTTVVATSKELPAELLEDLNAALASNDQGEVDRILSRARDFGWSLKALGEALGVSRERARQRVNDFAQRAEEPSTTVYATSPRLIKRNARHAAKTRERTKVNGFKMNDPVLQVPASTLNELARLSELATANRTWTPLDAPERAAVEPYKAMLIDLIENHGVSTTALERLLGYRYRTVYAWLARHGYGTLPPSQHAYTGQHVSELRRSPRQHQKTIVLGGTCKKGHLVTEETMVMNGKIGYICGTCRKERAAAAYQRKKADRLLSATANPDRPTEVI